MENPYQLPYRVPYQFAGSGSLARVNMPIQGTAADVLKKAMIDVSAALVKDNAVRKAPARMILTVHDELLFEAPEGEAAHVADLVRDVMERAFTLDVPLTVDVGIGKNWKDAKP
jgi:DNA polymerase-1